MMGNSVVKIVAFAGSTRQDSLNKKLLKTAIDGARSEAAQIEFVDLRDFSMPLYDGDLEAELGLPDAAIELKRLFVEADGFLIASPEYNSGYSAVLKNTIDWVSRPADKNEPSLIAYKGKYAALMSASPGGLGGLRGLYQLRELLMNMGVLVLPNMQTVRGAFQAFDENGDLKDEALANSVKALGAELVTSIT